LQLPPRLPGLTLPSSACTTSSFLKLAEGNQAAQTITASQINGYNAIKVPEKAQPSSKRTTLPVMIREEAAFMDYDFGLCSNQIEL